MAKVISLVVLVVILLLVAGLFFHVMADFLLPLFLAVLLVIMFGPLYRWLRDRCGGHERIAAALTTTAILLMVLAPLLLLLVEAGYEAQGVYRAAIASPARRRCSRFSGCLIRRLFMDFVLPRLHHR